MKRILLATMPVGGGHTALRDSLRTTLASLDPGNRDYELLSFDSQDTRVSGFYDFCIHRAPWLQALLFSLGHSRGALTPTVLLNPQLEAETRQALVKHRPDLVISTHFLQSAMFVRARRQLGLDVPIVSAIPDYGEPTEIFAPSQEAYRLDALIVMVPQVRERLRVRGHYPLSRVHLSGFIPKAPFLEMGREMGARSRLSETRRRALLETLRAEHPQLQGVDPSRPTLLFLGGSAWTSKTMPVLERLLNTPALMEHLNVLVVCGRNERFHDALKARVQGQPRVALFGFVNASLMARLMALADLPVLGSLAPASMHELMETRCGPLMLFHIIPGSEDAHPAYIQEQEIGVYETNPDAMINLLAQATGITPAGPAMARLLRVCPERMRTLRATHMERASQLGTFLERLTGREPRTSLLLEPARARRRAQADSAS
ncbi:hypothetical protein [Cystobacter ferrugineus]|uniref:Galactosyldiacylglycerol synthase n=1 Tax=Cystobacter ferrugineus TaxID=83449 RepID=A0A1L9B4J2_9BACT|nr:hypothetical protein [Cystobacter ferrugineus]OJH37174.1 hypothetical protein BON30_28035 [Cystobacter ferrugineus]